MSYSCYESDYRNEEQYIYLRDMALKKAQAQQTTKNESTPIVADATKVPIRRVYRTKMLSMQNGRSEKDNSSEDSV